MNSDEFKRIYKGFLSSFWRGFGADEIVKGCSEILSRNPGISQPITSDFAIIFSILANVVKFTEYSVSPLYPIREFVLLAGCSTQQHSTCCLSAWVHGITLAHGIRGCPTKSVSMYILCT